METGEVIYDKVYASPRPPPKISLKHDWMKELGSEVARQAKSSQSTQPNPNRDNDRTERPVVCSERASHPRFSRESQNPILEDVNHERTGRPVVCLERASRPQEIETRSSREEDVNHERTGRPVVCRDTNHERSMLNEVDIDFRIPGLPHSVVKQAENYRVRELVKQIENHPHRQSLQQDLQQNNAHNPLSEKSKKMMKDMGNVERFELFETEPKTQCKECPLYWSQGIVFCTCGHLLQKVKPTEAPFNVHWTFSQFKIMSLRRDDLMATDMGKLQNKEIIMLPII